MDEAKRSRFLLGADAAKHLPIVAESTRASIARTMRARSSTWHIATLVGAVMAVVAGHRAMAPIAHGAWEAVAAAGLAAVLLVATGTAVVLHLRCRLLASELGRIERELE
ncbi:MAG: hypothetical protein JNK11_16150 [Alphaproteobacteria bacterium]|nr:hypothetical protein [Alphaproteobacteria bacterium]